MTKITQSKELTAFYNAYNDWLESGAPTENEYYFSPIHGLCSSMIMYCGHGDTNITSMDMVDEQQILFKKANLNISYPFGRDQYYNGFDTKTQHLDPNRITWVKAHLTEEVDMEFTLQN